MKPQQIEFPSFIHPILAPNARIFEKCCLLWPPQPNLRTSESSQGIQKVSNLLAPQEADNGHIQCSVDGRTGM